MRSTTSRRTMTAIAVGLVLTMSGCATPAVPPEEGDLYAQARDRYTAMAEQLHTVIMGIEETDWAVDQGQHGARPGGCQLGVSAEFGYSFTAVRTLELPGRDADEISTSAIDAFSTLGIEAESTSRGSGDALEVSVVGENEAARTVVTVSPHTGQVRVSSGTDCVPGSSTEIEAVMFGEEMYPIDVWRRLPATEGPASVPQFYFPADGPLYYDEAGAPVQPQPLVTTPPTPSATPTT